LKDTYSCNKSSSSCCLNSEEDWKLYNIEQEFLNMNLKLRRGLKGISCNEERGDCVVMYLMHLNSEEDWKE